MANAGEGEDTGRRLRKSPDAFRTISEVASELDVPQHVLRFWESKFSQIKPLKRGGGRRYYRPEDVDLLRGIRHLLYTDGYTIKGVQKLLREKGAKAIVDSGRQLSADPQAKPVVGAAPPPVETGAAPAAGLNDAQRRKLDAAIDELTSLQQLLKSALD